jgi:hypothetical protein
MIGSTGGRTRRTLRIILLLGDVALGAMVQWTSHAVVH